MFYGEKVTIRHRWNPVDFENGLVDRCTHCGGGDSDFNARYADVYKQAGESYCTFCFGTGFEGGFAPTLYIAYALVGEQNEKDWTQERTGMHTPANPPAQFLWTPSLQEHDMFSRFAAWDGDTPVGESNRYELEEVNPVTLRTGPRKAPPADPLTAGGVGVTAQVIVAQSCTVLNLPQHHPLYQVQMTP
jgi:hypothetical protein